MPIKSLFLFLSFVVTQPILADTLYVDASTPGSGSGSDWSVAYRELQSAIFAAKDGDEILVAEGIYTPGSNRTNSFHIDKSLTIIGGYPKGGGTRNPDAHPTILSGDLGTPTDRSDNAYHVVQVTDGDDTTFEEVRLDGVQVSGGNADLENGSGNGQGAGIDSRENLTLDNVTIHDNIALNNGGGITLRLGTLSISNSIFTDNHASGTNGSGGAIHCTTAASFEIIDCEFSRNRSEVAGGAIHSFSSASTSLVNCSFDDNRSGAYGGALANSSTSPTITGCRFSENRSNAGGGIYNLSSSGTLTNCVFAGNEATGDGGALFSFNSSQTLINCEICGNHAASNGGGISTTAGSQLLINCTLSGNDAGNNGGGIANFSSSPELTNCIVWNNRDLSGIGTANSSVYESIGVAAFSHCLIQGRDPSGTNNLDGTDPSLSPLFVLPVDPETAPSPSGDLRLLDGSPALNAGDNTTNSEAFDLAGSARVQNSTIDLGPYEGGAGVTFALLHPGLSPEADDNHNEISNFGDYASGRDPAAPSAASLLPMMGGSKLTFSYRNNAADVSMTFEKTKQLLANSWVAMVLGIDYSISSSTSNGNQTIVVLDLLSTEPILFFRQTFQKP